MRLRKIRKYGNTFVIPLALVDIKDFGVEVGDEIDVEEVLRDKRRSGEKNGKEDKPNSGE